MALFDNVTADEVEKLKKEFTFKEIIYFKVDNFNAELHLPACILYSTQGKLKKLFKLMAMDSLLAPYGQPTALDETEKALKWLVDKSKDYWHKASLDFQNGYKAPEFQNPCVRDLTKRNNDKLLREVKKYKSEHDKYIKLLKIFTEIKEL